MQGNKEAIVAALVRCEHCGRTNRVPAAATGIPRCANCHQPLPWIADAGDSHLRRDRGSGHDTGRPGRPLGPLVRPLPMVSPVLERLAPTLAGRFKLVKVNIDEAPELAAAFDVHAVPTLLILRKGEVTARQAGALPLPALRTWVEHALA